jgi:hypothetical protein
MITEQQFKDYFPLVPQEKRENFSVEIKNLLSRFVNPYCNPEQYAKLPVEASVKESAKALLGVLEVMDDFTRIAIEDACQAPYILEQLTEGCRNIAKKRAKKRATNRCGIIIKMAALYSEYINNNIAINIEKSDFVDFCHSCFLLHDRNFHKETVRTMIRTTGEDGGEKFIPTFARMCHPAKNKPSPQVKKILSATKKRG